MSLMKDTGSIYMNYNRCDDGFSYRSYVHLGFSCMCPSLSRLHRCLLSHSPYVQHVAVAADSVALGTFSGAGALSSSTANPMPQICWIISSQSEPKF
eukprot:5067592-Ditylum_brightwellii.AAC.1